MVHRIGGSKHESVLTMSINAILLITYNAEISHQLETKGLRKLQRLAHTETMTSTSGTREIGSVFFKIATHLILLIACSTWMRTLAILLFLPHFL